MGQAKAGLSADTFEKLLNCLDQDRERAGEKYEDLRRVLTRYFEWRDLPFADDYVDETFNRVMKKLGDGVEVRSLTSYCHEVARLIFLETTRTLKPSRDSVEEQIAARDQTLEVEEKESNLQCLEQCLEALPAESARLILEYYDYDERNQIERRREMAARLGVRRAALGNRAQRVRDKLEACVKACRKHKQTTRNPGF
jgi:RNA polymerase sigma factor (sigma-70 family)